MSNGNYPAGAANDRSAPWNQSSHTCPKCDGDGMNRHTNDDDEILDCDLCDGSGEVDEDTLDEWLEDHRDYDEDDD